MIQLRNVSKHYSPDIIALEDISFDVDSGEFIFLVGPSGAGKSTLIRLLIRQELPTQGSIMFDDTDVVHLNRSLLPFYRQQIGVVFQDYKLIDTKTIRENIEFALQITGNSDAETQETADSLLDVVGLVDRQSLFPAQLSGGEKQRASIARALANEPKLLIADEPTGNLDPETSLEIMKILEAVNGWGTTVMIATHNKDIVDMMRRRVLRLENGTVVCDEVGGYLSKKKNNKKLTSTKKQLDSGSPGCSGSIDDLHLPANIIEALKKNNIASIDSLLDMSETDIANLKSIGPKETSAIVDALASFVTSHTNETA